MLPWKRGMNFRHHSPYYFLSRHSGAALIFGKGKAFSFFSFQQVGEISTLYSVAETSAYKFPDRQQYSCATCWQDADNCIPHSQSFSPVSVTAAHTSLSHLSLTLEIAGILNTD